LLLFVPLLLFESKIVAVVVVVGMTLVAVTGRRVFVHG